MPDKPNPLSRPAPARGPAGGALQQRKRPARTSSGSRNQGQAGILRFYADETPGLKIGPTTVLVMSLMFIGFVVLLHIYGKLTARSRAGRCLQMHATRSWGRGRGDATWIFRGANARSGRRSTIVRKSSLGGVGPRPSRGEVAATPRGATWIFRGAAEWTKVDRRDHLLRTGRRRRARARRHAGRAAALERGRREILAGARDARVRPTRCWE